MPTADSFKCAACGEQWLLGTSHVCAVCGEKYCAKCIHDGLCKVCNQAEVEAAEADALAVDDDLDWPITGTGEE